MNGLLYILMNIGNVLVEQSSLIKEVERKLSIIPKEKPNIIVITVGGRKGENKESRDSGPMDMPSKYPIMVGKLPP